MVTIRPPEDFPETVREVRRQLAFSQRQFEQFCKDNVKKGSLDRDEVRVNLFKN